MDISGHDIIYYTSKTYDEFFELLFVDMKGIWSDLFLVADQEDGTMEYFFAKDKNMFDDMDDKGFYLNNYGEGPFLIIFNYKYSANESRITAVLPGDIMHSAFCKKIDYVIKNLL